MGDTEKYDVVEGSQGRSTESHLLLPARGPTYGMVCTKMNTNVAPRRNMLGKRRAIEGQGREVNTDQISQLCKLP